MLAALAGFFAALGSNFKQMFAWNNDICLINNGI